MDRCAALLLVSMVACAPGPVVRVAIEVPATVPLRTFPHVYVSGGIEPEAVLLAENLIAHLRQDGAVRVERADPNSLEQMRTTGALPAASVVVIVDLRFALSSTPRYTSRPETVCGPGGCYTRQRSEVYDVPQLEATATVSVYEGPTAILLQRRTLAETAEGRREPTMRELVTQRLSRRLLEAVDPRVEALDVRLAEVALPGVAAALTDAVAGRWHDARRALERVARSENFQNASEADRAALQYDLGLARRFDPVTLEQDPERHFDVAEEALQRAITLDPRPLYAGALESLRAHRRDRALLAAQREAAQHNFALDAPGEGPPPTLPAPPPGYDR